MRRLALLFLIVFPVILYAKTVYLTGLRIKPSKTSTRLIFNLTEKTSGKIKYMPNPDRVIIDFDNTQKKFDLKNVQIKGSNIKTITAAEIPNGTRFLLSLRTEVKWKNAFSPNGDHVLMEIEFFSVAPKTKMHQVNSDPPTETTSSFTLTANNLLDHLAKLAEVANQNILQLDKASVAHVQQEMKLFKKPRVYRVVIDAGHGGKDPGAHGKNGTEEKHVVLSIAKKLAKEINARSNMRAILTRDGDYFVPLRERIKLARKDDADLFVAIHADAYFDNTATGASVFALSKRGATSEAARWLAKRENYSELDGVELDALKDRSPLLRSVLIDLAQTTTIRDSLYLGNKVLDALDAISSLHRTHVEQAPFVVLKSPDIPSILIETGFITNPHEEKRLADPNYQEKIARALASGISEYINKYAKIEESI